MNHAYYIVDGEYISREKVEKAASIIRKVLESGSGLTYISDEELFLKGDKLDAIKAFMKKHHCGLLESRAAIEFLRGEDIK